VAGENLRAALDWLPMGRKLVTVKPTATCRPHRRLAGAGAAGLREPDKEALAAFYDATASRAG
jgi:DNA polymerase-1